MRATCTVTWGLWSSWDSSCDLVVADVCLVQRQVMGFTVSALQVSVHLGNWQQVLNYYSKAEASPEMTDVRSTM